MSDINSIKITCFNAYKENNKNCDNINCRYWHELNSSNNCIINKSNEKTHTLQEIGNILDITRMRVCQIEKKTLFNLKKSLEN